MDLDQHVRLCDGCADRLDDLRAQRRALRLLAAAESGSPMTRRVLRVARDAGRHRIRKLLRGLARACTRNRQELGRINAALDDIHVLGRRMTGLGEDLGTARLPERVDQGGDLLVAMFSVVEILDGLDAAAQKPTAAPSLRDSLAPK